MVKGLKKFGHKVVQMPLGGAVVQVRKQKEKITQKRKKYVVIQMQIAKLTINLLRKKIC